MHPGGENNSHHEGNRKPEKRHALMMALEIHKNEIVSDNPIFQTTNNIIVHLICEILNITISRM